MTTDEIPDLGSVKDALWLEWHPLDRALLPVEHVGGGRFACLALRRAPEHPVVLFDAMADLGAQALEQVAASWAEYKEQRAAGWWPDFDATAKLDFEHRVARQVSRFEHLVDEHHARYREANPLVEFDHDQPIPLPRFDEWKPVRFCVADDILGLLYHRYDRIGARVEVDVFVTRDHTAYPHGSGTRALLLTLLGELVRQRGTGGIAFVGEGGAPAPRPRELEVLAEILLGRSLRSRDGANATIIDEDCSALLLALTPMARALRDELQGSQIGARAAIAVINGVIGATALHALRRACPYFDDAFHEPPYPEEQSRHALLVDHLAHAEMLTLFERELLASRSPDARAKPPEASLEAEVLDEWFTVRYTARAHLALNDGRELPSGTTLVVRASLDAGLTPPPVAGSGMYLFPLDRAPSVTPAGWSPATMPDTSDALRERGRQILRSLRVPGGRK